MRQQGAVHEVRARVCGRQRQKELCAHLISVLLSGLPPAGGLALPPNRLVMRRMNVLLPQPLSAARPISTVRCLSAAIIHLMIQSQ